MSDENPAERNASDGDGQGEPVDQSHFADTVDESPEDERTELVLGKPESVAEEASPVPEDNSNPTTDDPTNVPVASDDDEAKVYKPLTNATPGKGWTAQKIRPAKKVDDD